MPPWAAVVTVAIVVEYYAFVLPILYWRRRTGIHAPAMHGHPNLERAIRVHLNTLEKLPVVLPTLWIAAWTAGDVPAAAAGGAWMLSRLVFAVGYLHSAKGRYVGALLGDACEFTLIGLAAWGAISALP